MGTDLDLLIVVDLFGFGGCRVTFENCIVHMKEGRDWLTRGNKPAPCSPEFASSAEREQKLSRSGKSAVLSWEICMNNTKKHKLPSNPQEILVTQVQQVGHVVKREQKS